MVVGVVVAAFAVPAAALIGYVMWRDRRRLASTEERAIGARASFDAHMLSADRHARQAGVGPAGFDGGGGDV